MTEEEIKNTQEEEQPQQEENVVSDAVAENEAADTAEEPAEEKDPLEAAKAEIEELKTQMLYKTAEFDNYRKRTLKEKADLILNGSEKALTSILPIVDDMERAKQTMDNATDVAAVRKGVALIYNKFMQTLEQNGVKPIVTEGQALDTDFHEAIAVIEAPSEELKGKVLDCVQRGYTLNDKVIRHAKVVIGK